MTIGGISNNPYSLTNTYNAASSAPVYSSSEEEDEAKAKELGISVEDYERRQRKEAGLETPVDKLTKEPGERSTPEDCETCKNRKYQDASDEGNVSFKQAAHVSPTAAGAAVRAHENMHVSNAYSKAKQDGGEVVEAYVTIKTSVCPECGRTYVSGGNTHTQIRYNNESNPYQQDRKAQDAADLVGQQSDYTV